MAAKFAAGAALRHGRRAAQVWLTKDVVTSPPGGFCNVLVNPGNEKLVGTRLPYFPRGGPVPEDPVDTRARTERDWLPPGFVTQWGGMEVGAKLVYPIQTVDGMVSMLGGWGLRRACQALPEQAPGGIRCPVGEAVVTPATGRLGEYFRHIVHTVPPFYDAGDDGLPSPGWTAALERCWERSLDLAARQPVPSGEEPSIAAPLLGAGARGAPPEHAVALAARAVIAWLQSTRDTHGAELRLVVQRESEAEALNNALEAALAGARHAGGPDHASSIRERAHTSMGAREHASVA